MTIVRDQNGNKVHKQIRREADGSWGRNVWFGCRPATLVRRYFYATRAAANDGDISDDIGRRGRVR